ncbi:MAG: alpha/beta hydrolase [Acidobacteriota bacterium]
MSESEPADRSSISDTTAGPIEWTLRRGPNDTGSTVIVVHGGHSNCHEELGITALVEAGHSVLVPSRPGYGRTPLSTGERAETAADALADLVRVLDLGRVAVLGISAGGPTAIHLAVRHPKAIDRLILASAVTQIWHQPGDGRYETMQRLFGRAETAVWAMTRAMFRLAPRWMARTMMASMTDRDLDTVMASFSDTDLDALRQMIARQASGHGFLADLEHRVADEVLPTVVVPTLIVHSPSDAAVPFAHAEHAARSIPGARLVEAPSPCGHLIWFGPGGEVADAAILDFLRTTA